MNSEGRVVMTTYTSPDRATAANLATVSSVLSDSALRGLAPASKREPRTKQSGNLRNVIERADRRRLKKAERKRRGR